MSLDKAEAVPVDTHVWQIAKRDYNYASGNGRKSITEKLHRDIGQYLCTSSVVCSQCCTDCKHRLMVPFNCKHNVQFLHRGFFQTTVGSLCWLGTIGQCCHSVSVRKFLSCLLQSVCYNHRVSVPVLGVVLC